MAYKCDSCGKGIMIGKQHTHHAGVAGGRWLKRAPKTQKIFKPNLHVAHVVWHGVAQKVKLCTKCLRVARLAKDESKQAKNQNTPKLTPIAATAT